MLMISAAAQIPFNAGTLRTGKATQPEQSRHCPGPDSINSKVATVTTAT